MVKGQSAFVGVALFFYPGRVSKREQSKQGIKMKTQSEMRFGPYEVKQIQDLPQHEVAVCQDYKDAIVLCMNRSLVKRSRRTWAELLDMKEGTLSGILNGSSGRKRTFDPDLFPLIESLAGNRAISQFFNLQSRGLLHYQNREAQIEYMRAQLAELEREQLRHAG